MKHIPGVTLVSVATTEVEATAKALEYSVNSLRFDKVLLISHFDPAPHSNTYEYIQIDPFKSVADWGRFIIFDLYKYIDTDFIILIHADGFIVNPSAWDPAFLQYDYIGAPWALSRAKGHFIDANGNNVRVGNSVSLRSAKLLKAPSLLGLNWDTEDQLGYLHEDGFLCAHNKILLESKGIKFAPLDLACHFSRENPIPENKGITPFAFHKWKGENKNYPRFTNKERIDTRLKGVIRKLIKRISGNDVK
ncbi:MAG: hypothetical protein ISR69_14140 [Gammaproteobacteria bacterium]|nr:hypothetical protein [Gammaproteobacteria bacterium]